MLPSMTTALSGPGELSLVAFPAAAMRLRVSKARLCELVLVGNVSLFRQGPTPAEWFMSASDVERLKTAATPPGIPEQLDGLRPGWLDVFRLLADWGGTATMRELEAGTGADFTAVWRALKALGGRGLAAGKRGEPWHLTDLGADVAERWSATPH
jgi:hypothetical protein